MACYPPSSSLNLFLHQSICTFLFAFYVRLCMHFPFNSHFPIPIPAQQCLAQTSSPAVMCLTQVPYILCSLFSVSLSLYIFCPFTSSAVCFVLQRLLSSSSVFTRHTFLLHNEPLSCNYTFIQRSCRPRQASPVNCLRRNSQVALCYCLSFVLFTKLLSFFFFASYLLSFST